MTPAVNAANSHWTDSRIARLKLLWAEGHSTAEIGRRMKCGKNAVIGKARRLGLIARPSPIKREKGPKKKRIYPPKPRSVDLTVLPSIEKTQGQPPVSTPRSFKPGDTMYRTHEANTIRKIAAANHVGWERFAGAVSDVKSEVTAPYIPRIRRRVELASRPGDPCAFPFGEPRTKSFRYCGKPSVTKRGPYCLECSRKAFVGRELNQDASKAARS